MTIDPMIQAAYERRIRALEAEGASRRQDIDALTEQKIQLARQIEAWQETAVRCHRNTEFYWEIVTRIGEMFGQAAKTVDDGSVQEDVLVLKVPKLVEVLVEHLRVSQEACVVWEANCAEVAATMRELSEELAMERARAAEVIGKRDYAIRELRTPCRCDPPGSGEHYNGVCRVRAALEQHLDQSMVWGNAGVLMAFDEAVLALWPQNPEIGREDGGLST